MHPQAILNFNTLNTSLNRCDKKHLNVRKRSSNNAKSSLGDFIPSVAVLLFVAFICLALVVGQQAHQSHHEEHKHHKYNPYKYGYKIIDHKGNKQWKQEESHHPMEVKGSYGFKDKHGLFREVSYVADKHGFRAHVKTNEPGTAPKNPAAVKMDAHPDPSLHKNHYGGSMGHH